jgi:ABC-2 type transport system permease protein
LVGGLGMLGLLLASTFVLLPNANALANALDYPVWLLSGVLVAITALPVWAGRVADLLPTTWGARAVRAAISGEGGVWGPVGICLGLGAAAMMLGFVVMDIVERRARRAATLTLS